MLVLHHTSPSTRTLSLCQEFHAPYQRTDRSRRLVPVSRGALAKVAEDRDSNLMPETAVASIIAGYLNEPACDRNLPYWELTRMEEPG